MPNAGDIVRASDLTYKLDNRCRVYKSDLSTQSVASATTATITFSSVEYDPNGMFNNASDTITIPEAGIYAITLALHWQDSVAASDTRVGVILVNGVSYASSGPSADPGTANDSSNSTTNFTGYLAAGDAITARAWQNSGVALTLDGHAPPTSSRLGCYLTVVQVL
jgi:hypothetical protein